MCGHRRNLSSGENKSAVGLAEIERQGLVGEALTSFHVVFMMGTVTSLEILDSSSYPVCEWVLIEWVFLREKIVAVLFFCRAGDQCGDEDWIIADKRVT